VTRNFYGKLIGSFPPFDPREKVERLLLGAIDTHFHAGPHVYAVCRSEIEYGLKATEAGMQAIFDKGSTTPTARSALLVQEIVNQWAKEHNSPVAWPWEETLQAFREIGTDRFVIASDLGNWRKPDPIDMYKITIGLLLEYGIPEADVAKMVRLNAEKLIWGDP